MARGYAPQSGARVAAQIPGRHGARIPEVDLTAHDHVDEPVAREIDVLAPEPLIDDALGVLRIGIPRRVDDNPLAGALEIAECRTASRIDQRLDGHVRVLGRVMNLRDVVHCGDAVVELRESGEQFINVHVLRG